MAQNPFQSSPYDDSDFTTEKPTTVSTPAARGMAPSVSDVAKRASELGIDPKLALSFFTQESSGNFNSPDSNKGARGGMQVMPGTYRSMMGTEAGQRDPWNNMESGLRYIAYGQKTLGTKDPELLAAGYHAGYDRKDLKAGRIPDTSDGSITTADYARSVAARVNGGGEQSHYDRVKARYEKPSATPAADEFSDTPVTPSSKDSDFSDTPVKPAVAGGPVDTRIADTDPTAPEKGYIDRLVNETSTGFGDTKRSLTAGAWAFGKADEKSLAEDMAKSFQEQAAQPKNATQKEIDAAYQGVTDAKGVVDTTIAGAKALGTSLIHPAETSLEIARNAANSLPTLVGGAAGAGAGAGVGAGVGAMGAGVGAIPGAITGAIVGGKAGMAAGTTMTELGGEVQDMVQKRLEADKQEPTAQNILAILSDKKFKDDALKQGLAKGLTVAAVDQVFMGFGGKIATAPARKIASEALAEQGADMSTRAARNAALASPAGKAALEAAKPALAAKLGAEAAAVGVDAAGESIGEGASQKVARGEIDYGDALREGVASIGQSAAQVAAGVTIETAKHATGHVPVEASPAAPSTAAGPLARATENAAAKPERVTVTAADGQVSGTVTGQTQDGTAVQVTGDDGQVYTFATGPDGVKITPEAPNTPLSNALEVAASEVHAENPAAPMAVAVPAPEDKKPEEPAAVAAPVAAEQPAAEPAAKTPDLEVMSADELRARLKYIADQAKTNGGWNKMLVEQRRAVEKQINARTEAAPAVETPKAEDFTSVAPKAADPVAQATPAQQASAELPKELAGAKPRYNYGKKAFDLNFASDVDKAAFIASQPTKSKRDADYLAHAMSVTGMSEDEVRAHGAQVREAIKAMAKDGKPGTLKVPEQVRGATVEKTPAPKAEPTTAELMQAAKDSGKLEIINVGDTKPKLQKMSKAEEEHLFGTDKKRTAALDRIAKGTAYFGTPEKAKDFITKNGLKDTHTVEQTGKVRFEVKPKAENVTDERTSGKPASAEAVGQEANAGQAKATPVQSDAAPQEVIKSEQRTPTAKEIALSQDAPHELDLNKKETGWKAVPIANGDGTVLVSTDGTKAVTFATKDAKSGTAGMRARAEAQAYAIDNPYVSPKAAEIDTSAKRVEEIVKPEPAADDATPLQRTEAEIAEMEWRRSLPVNAGQRDFIDGEIAKLEELADLIKKTDASAQTVDETAKADPFADNKLFTSDAVAKARARMKSKLTQFNSGLDPEMLVDGMTIAGAYIETGVRTFSAYSKAMIDDFGPKIKPYLLSFYEAARNYPGLKTEDLTPVTDAKAEFDALNATTDTQPTKAKGNDNGPQKLDQSGSRELEGKQPDALQGAEPQREAGNVAQGSGGTDLLGGERAGSSGPQSAGRVGNDAGEVSASASRGDAGRGGKQGSSTVQRGERAAKPDSSIGRDTGNQPSLIPEDGTRAQDRADGFVITQDDAIGEGGQKTKFKQNVAAIRLLKQLTTENRQATRAEQAVLAKYVGWGGIPQAFYRDNNEVSKGWEKEAAELKDVMTPAELDAAAASTRNAHYTSTEIVSAVWDAAKHFGFQGGRVLEPSVGVGNFFGMMPTALRSASQLTGVELDHITGGIAKQLYPQANIAAPVGFQNFSAPDNYFELAIGNPPFGREGIYDPTRKKISGFSIHNYFFGKSIDTVKPNGVLAMVVTNRLLDSTGDKARSYIAERSEFLGAIRLPNDAFAKNAGTQVTTDIIFLRKLKDGEQPTGQRWMDVRQYKDKDGNSVPLNEYFVRNPEMMLGDFGQYGSMYSAEDAALVARPGQDTPALLQSAVAKLPKGFMDAPTAEPTRETIEPMHDISRVKVGSVFEQGGQIFERREDMLGKQQAAPVTFPNEKAKERVTGMIGMRDALIDVRGMQLQEGVNEKELEAARKQLNKTYDAFMKANGPLNADANKKLMRDDPTWPQIAALEDGFDKGITLTVAKTTGEKARAPSARKAAIFSKRTQSPYKAPEKATSAKDAMVSSLAERGRVDLDYMAGLYGKTPVQIASELSGLIYKNPAGGWESRDQYLSGNVKKKLAQAIDAAKADPSLKGNVDALKAVQPADIEAVDIDVKTGAHWVPADVMENFVNTIAEGEKAKAIYNPVAASWTLNVDRASQAAQTQWSTDRASLRNVLEAAANSKQLTIYDKFADGTRTLNEAATTAANEKVERVKAEWKNWIWGDDARRERLARIYNDTFNTDVQRDYDGSHLSFPGKVGDDIIQLRPHQANAVWRMVQSGTTLLDHVVGAGKTFTMIAGIMEMRRMGLAKKPMLAVPNHLVGQWAEDFMKLYPGANILAATKKDFEKGNRKRLFARIATGDWDAVIVAHSSLGKVEMEPEFQENFIKQQIADMDTSIVAMREAEGKGSRNVKQIEKQKAALEEKLKKLFDTGSKDDNLHFGELGVDALLLDEAHEFKNLGFSTGMQRVAGLGSPAGSNKAADMFMKVQATLKRTGGKNVVFATGTPISNTMAEMYTMQRYLDYGTLKDQGIAHFDAWAKTFGEVVTDWELSPSGQYKMNSRFAKFVNMPELMQRYGSFADVINRDDINRQLAAQGKKLPVPKVAGGKPENTVVERSQDQANYIGVPAVDENGIENYPEGSLVYRAENLPKKAVKGSDNMLKIMSDARKAALDMRLIDPSLPDNPASKVNVAANNIKATYDKWDADKGTQLVFCDLSTPKGAVAKEAAALRELVKLAEEGDEAAQSKLDAMSPDELLALDSSFSVYDDLKAKLIAKGIPENEVAFIHDAGTDLQKAELFAKVRTGRVRVLIGSTSKMGAGMNVQDRLVALHHLDAPWRPSDLEQREGRIIRQGNTLYEKNPEGFEVQIKRYATKQTLDSRMWQTIEAKARFIEQVRKGTGEREVEDVAGEASNSAEMKAASSGNPLILEEMSLRQGIRKLENQKAEHNREQFRIRDRIRMVGDLAKANDRDATQFDADAPKAPKEFTATIGNQTFDKPKEAGEAILSAVSAMHHAGDESRDLGTFGGFKLIVDDTSNGTTPSAVLTIKGTGEYQVSANPGSDPTGLGQRMRNTVRDLAEMAQTKRDQAQRNRDEVPKLQAQIKPWGSEQELAEATARHSEVIDQLKPKKKPEAAKPEGDVRMSRADDLKPLFAGLEGRGMTKKQALAEIDARSDSDAIHYIEDNFLDILTELDDSGRVDINC